jgi:hypothetical protein
MDSICSISGKGRDMAKQFDFFISYKREDVGNVRQVVDALIGSGARVWFAEYEILISNYNDFQAEIDRGIDSSLAAVIFTNDRWVESPFCQKEYERIARVIKPTKIVDVQIPPEKQPYAVFPSLRNCPSMIWKNNLEEIILFISLKAGIPLDTAWMQRKKSRVPHRKASLRFGVSLDTGSLSMVPTPMEAILWNQAHGAMVGETYYFRDVAGDFVLQAMVHISPFFRIIDNPSTQDSGAMDDRELYRAFQVPAAEWLGRTGYRQTGLHVLRWQGHDHFGLSYLEDGRIWHRRYALSTFMGGSKDIGEIDIDVSVARQLDDHRPLPQEAFFRISLSIDQMAASLCQDSGKIQSEEIPIISWGLVAWGAVAIHGSFTWFASPIPSAITAFFAGLFIGQFLSLPFSRNAWIGPLKASMLVGPKTRFYLPLFPLFRRVWDIIFGLLSFNLVLLVSAPVIIIAAVVAAVVFPLSSVWYWIGIGAFAGIFGLREYGRSEKPQSSKD